MTTIKPDWISDLEDTVPEWLEEVSDPSTPGKYYPCSRGRTDVGNKAGLGFSCFALRIRVIMNMWGDLNPDRRDQWIAYIKGFQTRNGEFIDPHIIENITPYPLWKRIAKKIHPGYKPYKPTHPGLSSKEATILAETKQALATLGLVNAQSSYPFTGFPQTTDDLLEFLNTKLDWSRPWGAGGQAAGLAAFIALESGRSLTPQKAEELRSCMVEFFADLADPETGGFGQNDPAHDQLINGSMKVLNALEWLDVAPPHPEPLIDTVLSDTPKSEGCHLVDAVYVLYQCAQITDYRSDDINEYVTALLPNIRNHKKPDGAFSYYQNHNQTTYYGAAIATEVSQSDLQGTYLLTFALAMIGQLLDWDDFEWRYWNAWIDTELGLEITS